jgi:TRAP-type C4-dicarboxylate transport system substrate-binding protein
MDFGILITGGVGVISTIVSGWTSWYFTRKKYNTEVDHSLIENMQSSLEFYKQLSDDNRARLEEVLKRNEALEKEVGELRKQMFNLMSSICVDLTCQARARDLNLFNNGTITKENS